MDARPFAVTPTQVSGLGARFSEFVNRLLEAEGADHRLRGRDLATNVNDSAPDGGVDAAIRNAPETDWIPAGDSAWQFKRTDLWPAKCAAELEGAPWARQMLEAGGSYVLTLGAPLTDQAIERRWRAVVLTAKQLGLLNEGDEDRIRLYDANRLARWASRFPALAVSRLLGGPGHAATDFGAWSSSRVHQLSWVPDEAREAAISTIRREVGSRRLVDIRIEGPSGIGKTRLVMEALREESLRPLVAYVADEREALGDLVAHVTGSGRTVILVDECPAERHVKVAERLPTDAAIKLVTIGDGGPTATRTPIISVGPVSPEQTEAFLRENYLELSPEARRFIADHSRGNMRWTVVLAERVVGQGSAQAAEIIERNDIALFVATLLPEGRAFFCSAILALVERVGWDRELGFQLDRLAAFAKVSPEELRSVGQDLEQRGLLARAGRYRAVSPHPLAVYLAAEAWRVHGERIVSELLPGLDDSMAMSLFRRVADLGRFEPARAELSKLLAIEGAFGSLRSLEENGLGSALTQLAIVLPDEVADHLETLIQGESLEELRAQSRSRRDLVWTIEKLAWHRRTFERGANCLLRLALAENESYANNASGTWVELFGTMLPGTAATPTQRVEYLEDVAKGREAAARRLVIKAGERALAYHEAIAVSAELQSGVLVEPRGSPRDWDEAGAYRRDVLRLLIALTSDTDPPTSDAAVRVLIDAVHPFIDDPWIGEDLLRAVIELRGRHLEELRVEVEHLKGLGDGDTPDGRPRFAECLGALAETLPPLSHREELMLLLRLRTWDFREDQLSRRLAAALDREPSERVFLLGLMQSQEVSAAWDVGRALALVCGRSDDVEDALTSALKLNPGALTGYLMALDMSGDESAFDRYFKGAYATRLNAAETLALAARGPVTAASSARILQAVKHVSVAEGASALNVGPGLGTEDFIEIASGWIPRVVEQRDYSALIDWFHQWYFVNRMLPEAARTLASGLLLMRKAHPDLGRQRWDWSRLAVAVSSDAGVELAGLLLDLVETNKVMMLRDDDEAQVLSACASAFPAEIWADVSDRIAAGGWRIQMEVRGWLLEVIPADLVKTWIGESLQRARLVASIAPVGATEPTDLARFLLGSFGSDPEIKSGLWGEFASGSWRGPESAMLEAQIAQLKGWRHLTSEPEGVRRWAAEILASLERRLKTVIEVEAEREI